MYRHVRNLIQQEQQCVAVGPRNAQFTYICQISLRRPPLAIRQFAN